MRQIIIAFVKHSEQRLGEIGDWFFDSQDNLHIVISDLGDWRYNILFARHEMDEALLCRHAGITTEMVDRDQLLARPDDNPDSFSGYPGSPYQEQHNDALAAEWVFSRLLGVEWTEYARAVSDVERKKEDAQERNGKRNRSQEGEGYGKKRP